MRSEGNCITQTRITNLTGSNGKPIAGVRWQAGQRAANRVAICLPGMSYPSDGPVTFYVRQAFLAAGWDWWSIDYRYPEDEEFARFEWPDRDRYIRRDATEIGSYLGRSLRGRGLVLVGKSLGTIMIDQVLIDGALHRAAGRIGFVILTPTDVQASILDALEGTSDPALFVAGDADRFFDPALARRADAMTNVRQLVIPGAGHVLEDVHGNIAKSIQNLIPSVDLVRQALAEDFFG